ncbi:MAG: Nif3-like dinuclear metal center hexameric protein [Candidatus Melainabacteria bacterium RIFOXYA12_FULL_32_12]|nr:MAG: Nif3-like dinuclear metal center hexameric protein [Candidatus Melainabacteria bacterium RIFOXYA2_FULL_32_9]OGI31046.1 MAG: Nif3-like dinuclear metal center hexameric protein [Candidatus Melainabacteria bacterium RIFOXYA12_FULL_32_12]
MVKTNKIIDKVEQFAPLSLQSEWDNSGWQIYLGNFDVDRVLLALSPTLDVIDQAISKNCGLIIAHHPMIFGKMSKIKANNFTGSTIIKSIQNNIQIYSAHTNLDAVKNGVADKLAGLLNLDNIQIIEETGLSSGFGRIGELAKEENLDEFLKKLKQILNVSSLKLINPSGRKKIRRVAVCPGSGGDFIRNLRDVDLYITGDIRYHTALEIDNMVVVDAGHLETERIILNTLKELLQDLEIQIFIAEENSPWQIV